MVVDDPWKFRAICSKAILLIDNKELILEIENIIQDIYKLSFNPSLIATTDLPDNFSIKLPNGEIKTKKNIEMWFAIEYTTKKALEIAQKLNNDLKNT